MPKNPGRDDPPVPPESDSPGDAEADGLRPAGEPEGETRSLPRSVAMSSGAFSPGELIAQRFRVTRFVARGGMGEVFEAEDLELRERVALKTIRAEIAEDDAAMARFRREIQIARRVTHPNVSRVFDLFHHDDPGTGRVAFLTMEFLEGESLADHLRRRGRLSTAEADPLVRQMIAGLTAAHDAGVVHRDFKPDNVMLVDSPKGAHVVVTDFGLARSGATVESETVTGSRTLLGTPAYMAPEQVEGRAATPATDVYAFGIVLFEMVTGKRPFEGDSPLAVAAKRLKEDAPSPKRVVPDLDIGWERIISRCLERDPFRRFARASEILDALSEVGISERWSGRRLAAAAGLVASVALVALLVLVRSPKAEDPDPSVGVDAQAFELRPSLAVLGFRNLSGRSDVDWLSTALSEMLTTELSAGGQVRVLSGESVGRLKNDLSLGAEDGYARDTLAKIRDYAQVDFVLLGSYLASGEPGSGALHMNLRLQDTRVGETTAAVSENGNQEKLVDLVLELGASLHDYIGVVQSEGSERTLRASLPARVDAVKLYSEGLAKLRVFDYREAKEALSKAAQLEPGHPVIRSALAQAWWRLGYRARAQEEAKAAFGLAGDLPLEERLSIEALYRSFSESEDEKERANRLYGTLFDSYPDEIEYGLALARVQKPAEALETTEAMKKLPGGLGEDPRIDLAEAEAALTAGDYKRALTAAERAAEKAQGRGARLVVAEALLRSGEAHLNLGNTDRGLEAAERARTLYVAAGDPLGTSQALRFMAWPTLSRDELRAKSIFADSISLAREVGAIPQVAMSLEDFSQLLGNNGDHETSLRMAEEALSLWREVGLQVDVARGLHAVAWATYLQGDLGRAEELERESLTLVEEAGATATTRYPLYEIAKIRFERGYLQESKTLMEQSLALDRAEGVPEAWSLMRLAELLEEQGRLVEADQAYARAAEVYALSSDKGSLARVRLQRADLLVADSRFLDAKTELEAARQLAQELGETVFSTVVAAKLSLVLTRMGQSAVALRERERARQELNDFPTEVTMWRVDELGMAFVELGDLEAAKRCFEISRETARRSKNPLDVSFAEQRMAGILHRQGRLVEAKSLLERAVASQTQLKSEGNSIDAMFQLAQIAVDQGDVENAQQLHREIVDIAKRLSMDRRAAYAELDGYHVAVRAGNTIPNPARATAIAETFRTEELVYGEIYARYLIARDARVRGDLQQATASIARAKELSERILIRQYWNAWHLGHDLRRLVSLEAAQIQALTANTESALRELQTLEAEASRLGHVPLLLRTRLARGDLQRGTAEGQLELQRVEREAEEKGFGFIVDGARAVLRR